MSITWATPHSLVMKDELKEIRRGRLYPNLDTLADKGLVEKRSANKRTNSYILTERGRRELQAHREWEQQYWKLIHPSLLM